MVRQMIAQPQKKKLTAGLRKRGKVMYLVPQRRGYPKRGRHGGLQRRGPAEDRATEPGATRRRSKASSKLLVTMRGNIGFHVPAWHVWSFDPCGPSCRVVKCTASSVPCNRF